jgi:molybdate transport system permease protein
MTTHGSRVHGRPPAALVVPAMAAAALLVVPIVAVFIRAPWRSLPGDLTEPGVATALRLTLETTLITTGVSLVLGVPLGWVLARVEFVGRSVVRALVTLPLVLPPVVGGVALLLAFGRHGVVGQYLDDGFGLTVPFTTTGVVLAQTFVAMPFLVISVEGAFRASDARYDDAAATLGASRWLTFRRITVPLALPGIVSGAVLCWARAVGEFGATITFNGSLPGVTRTMPSEIYYVLQANQGAAIALSVLMVVVSVAILGLLRERWVSGVAP